MSVDEPEREKRIPLSARRTAPDRDYSDSPLPTGAKEPSIPRELFEEPGEDVKEADCETEPTEVGGDSQTLLKYHAKSLQHFLRALPPSEARSNALRFVQTGLLWASVAAGGRE